MGFPHFIENNYKIDTKYGGVVHISFPLFHRVLHIVGMSTLYRESQCFSTDMGILSAVFFSIHKKGAAAKRSNSLACVKNALQYLGPLVRGKQEKSYSLTVSQIQNIAAHYFAPQFVKEGFSRGTLVGSP